MSKDQKNIVEIDVETVDNLVQSLEWIVCSIKFWHIDKYYPTNLFMSVALEYIYKFRKLLAYNKTQLRKLKNNKKI